MIPKEFASKPMQSCLSHAHSPDAAHQALPERRDMLQRLATALPFRGEHPRSAPKQRVVRGNQTSQLAWRTLWRLSRKVCPEIKEEGQPRLRKSWWRSTTEAQPQVWGCLSSTTTQAATTAKLNTKTENWARTCRGLPPM